ncbi:hypothetical protein I6E29_04050 [Arcanobacterium haemolyticum]|nr:hypothetical protein [Arcanobacterium haemolyticum]
MNENVPGLGHLPELGSQEALLPLGTSPREIHSEVEEPVAHVHVEMPVPHMDRVFDYLVPPKLAEKAVVGARVAVEVGSQRVSGYIIGRDSMTDRSGALRPLTRVVSPVPVLTPAIYELCKAVASRQICPVGDVLRLAVPGRHARAEAAFNDAVRPIRSTIAPPDNSGYWGSYRGGGEFIESLAAGRSPRRLCVTLPGPAGSSSQLAIACAATLSSGRSVIITLPSSRAAAKLHAQMDRVFPGRVAYLASESRQEVRYTEFLRVLHGDATIVVGTRASVWVPARNLGLMIVVDDAAPALREQRSPHCETRDVAYMRARHENAGLLIYSSYVSEQSAALVARGALKVLAATPESIRQAVPRVSSPEQWNHDESSWSRIPEAAFSLVRSSLERGPVLVVVPRAGYIPQLACASCGALATCSVCGGNLAITVPGQAPTCSRCGARNPWQCDECGGGNLRSTRIGSHRTAEEIGKAFPGVGIMLSSSRSPDGIIESVSNKPRIVVATPGAEPAAEGGYAAALVLDSRFLQGTGLGSETQFLRLVTRIIMRVRSARYGGHVMFAGGISPEALSVLSSWSLETTGTSLFEEREALALPPAERWVAVSGDIRDVRRYVATVRTLMNEAGAAPSQPLLTSPAESLLSGGVHQLTPDLALIGPVTVGDDERLYLRFSLANSARISGILAAAHREYSAKGLGKPLRIEVDPPM